jgi:hypothetical protein
MTHSQLLKSAVAAGVCAAVGATAGIVGSAAAPSHSHKAHSTSYDTATGGPDRRPGPAGMIAFKIGIGGPPVHGVQIVPNKAGDGFDTVTQDSGTVKSISGDSLTITEGTDKATYATPTLTIPAGATVERNFQSAKLTDIQAGDHVDVSSSSGGTANVFAVDGQHWPPKPPMPPGFAKQLPAPGGPDGSAGVVYSYKAP